MKGDEPAFPTVSQTTHWETEDDGGKHHSWIDPGMTKRELFAGMAMQSYIKTMLSTPEHALAFKEGCEERKFGQAKGLAILALEAADALLAELERER